MTRPVLDDRDARESRGRDDGREPEVEELLVPGAHRPMLHQTTSAATASVSTIASSASQRPPAPAPWRCTGTPGSAGSADRARVGRLLHRVLVRIERGRLLRRRGRLGRRMRIPLDDLEQDDRDVVDAAGTIRGVDERFGSVDEGLRIGQVRRCTPDQLGDLLVTHDVGEPVGADQVEVAGRDRERHRLDVDARLGADGPRDHRSVRVLLGLLRRAAVLPGRARRRASGRA